MPEQPSWIGNSGCTRHMTPHRAVFATYSPLKSAAVYDHTGKPTPAVGEGTVLLSVVDTEGTQRTFRLNNVGTSPMCASPPYQPPVSTACRLQSGVTQQSSQPPMGLNSSHHSPLVCTISAHPQSAQQQQTAQQSAAQHSAHKSASKWCYGIAAWVTSAQHASQACSNPQGFNCPSAGLQPSKHCSTAQNAAVSGQLRPTRAAPTEQQRHSSFSTQM